MGAIPRQAPGRRRKRRLLVFDIIKRIQKAWAIPELAELLHSPITRERGDGDIWDHLLRDMSDEDKLTHMCMILHTDGTVLDKGKQRSYTPVVFQWLNLPPGVRQSFGGLLLLAVFPPKVLFVFS